MTGLTGKKEKPQMNNISKYLKVSSENMTIKSDANQSTKRGFLANAIRVQSPFLIYNVQTKYGKGNIILIWLTDNVNKGNVLIAEFIENGSSIEILYGMNKTFLNGFVDQFKICRSVREVKNINMIDFNGEKIVNTYFITDTEARSMSKNIEICNAIKSGGNVNIGGNFESIWVDFENYKEDQDDMVVTKKVTNKFYKPSDPGELEDLMSFKRDNKSKTTNNVDIEKKLSEYSESDLIKACIDNIIKSKKIILFALSNDDGAYIKLIPNGNKYNIIVKCKDVEYYSRISLLYFLGFTGVTRFIEVNNQFGEQKVDNIQNFYDKTIGKWLSETLGADDHFWYPTIRREWVWTWLRQPKVIDLVKSIRETNKGKMQIRFNTTFPNISKLNTKLKIKMNSEESEQE